MLHSPTLLAGLTTCIALKAYRIISNDATKTTCQVLAVAVTLARFSTSIASIAAMTMLSAMQLQKGWSTLKHSDAPLVLGAELSVTQLASFTLSAFFKEIQRWPEHPTAYPDLTYQIPAYVVLALATLALFYRRGTEGRSILFTGGLFAVAAVMMPQTPTHWALLNAIAAGVPAGYVLKPLLHNKV